MTNQGKSGALSWPFLMATFFSLTELKGQTEWTHVTDPPVLSFSATGAWDSGAVIWPAVIRDGDTLKMWDAGSDNVLGFGTSQIWYAWSLYGISWKRYAGNPVLSAELAWEVGDVVTPVVIKDGNTFRMWYDAVGNRLCHLNDGIRWDNHSDPVLQSGPVGDRVSDNFGSEAYLYWIDAVNFTQTRKMLLLK